MSFDRAAFLERLAGVRAAVEKRGLVMTGYSVRPDGVIEPITQARRRRGRPDPEAIADQAAAEPKVRRGFARPVQESLL